MKVRVLADGQALQNAVSVDRGVGRYVTEYSRQMERAYPGVIDAWVLRSGRPLPAHLPELVWNDRLALHDDPDLEPPDVWHVLSPFESLGSSTESLWPHWARGPRTRLAATLHDLMPLVYPERYLASARVRREFQMRVQLLLHADRILATSEATATDAVRLLGIPAARIDVVGNGPSRSLTEPAMPVSVLLEAQAGVSGLRPGYVLFAGGIDSQKNVDGLIAAYASLPRTLRRTHQLVLVSQTNDSGHEEVERRVRALGVADDVLMSECLTDGQLLAIYRAADLFVFPAVYKGFGLPVVAEGLSGALVIAGTQSSLHEGSSDQRVQVDGSDPGQISRGMLEALSGRSVQLSQRDDLDGAATSWSVVADRSVESYARLATTRQRVLAKPHVWLVSPMPPAASGVADYSMALLGELAKLGTVSVFSAPGTHTVPIPGVRWFTFDEADAVVRLHGEPDLRVFAMGNSEFHLEVLRLLRRYGGVVMAHDVRYTGLLSVASREAPDLLEQDALDALSDIASARRPRAYKDHVSMSAEEFYSLNGLMTEPALAGASAILVHSRSARVLARANLPASSRTRVHSIPFGHVLRPRSAPRDRDAVVSLGAVHWSKESETVCRAFIALAQIHPDLKFAIVGKFVDPAQRTKFEYLIASAGVAGRVSITGWADAEVYSEWIARARLAVQLRAHTSGETSAAIADCLGAGVPVVATGIGEAATMGSTSMLVKPGIEVGALVITIDGLIGDEATLARLADAGRAYAESNSFGAVAAVLLSSADRSQPENGPAGAVWCDSESSTRSPIVYTHRRTRGPGSC